MLAHVRHRTSPASQIIGPPATGDTLLEGFLICQLYRDIATGCLVIRQNRAEPKDSIETLEGFSRFTNQRPIPSDVVGEVSEQMKLRLRDDL